MKQNIYVGAEVKYKGYTWTVADNRGKGLNLWGGSDGSSMLSNVDPKSVKLIKNRW